MIHTAATAAGRAPKSTETGEALVIHAAMCFVLSSRVKLFVFHTPVNMSAVLASTRAQVVYLGGPGAQGGGS